jgi:hypothetical protein
MSFRRFSRAVVLPLVACAVAALSAVPATAASARTKAPAATPTPRAWVNVRVEGPTSTIFEGWVLTSPHDVTTPTGGTHPCNGLNNVANPTAGPTALTALADAAKRGNFSFDGTWEPEFSDFFITSIAGVADTTTQFWGLLDNDRFTPTSGCEFEVQKNDQVLWAYDAFNAQHFLKLAGPGIVRKGKPFIVTVTDGSTGVPIQGATVGTSTTDANGYAVLTYTTDGVQKVKAERADSIRSNALTTLVLG